MRFVNNRLVRWRPRMSIIAPVEIRIDHHGLGHERSAVLFVGRSLRVAEVVREHRLVPSHLTFDGPRIRVEQQLGWITAVTLLGSPRPMNTKAVPLPRPDVRQIAVAAKARYLRKVDPRFIALLIDEAKFYMLRDL